MISKDFATEIFPEERVNESKKIIKKMLEICKNPYIALSFGKDSLVMMDLIYSINPEIECIFLKSEETFFMYDFERVIDWYKNNKDIRLNIVNTTKNWQIAKKKSNKDFYLDDFFYGFDGVFMGLRIRESKNRKHTLIKKENNLVYKYIMKYKNGKRKNMYRCCPMAEWKAEEIYVYLIAKELEMLDIYKKDGFERRTTARFSKGAMGCNTLFWIKKNNPENFNKICKKIPEVKFFI